MIKLIILCWYFILFILFTFLVSYKVIPEEYILEVSYSLIGITFVYLFGSQAVAFLVSKKLPAGMVYNGNKKKILFIYILFNVITFYILSLQIMTGINFLFGLFLTNVGILTATYITGQWSKNIVKDTTSKK